MDTIQDISLELLTDILDKILLKFDKNFEISGFTKTIIKNYENRISDENFYLDEMVGDRVFNLYVTESLKSLSKVSTEYKKGFLGVILSNRLQNQFVALVNDTLSSSKLEVIFYLLWKDKEYSVLSTIAQEYVNFAFECSNKNMDDYLRISKIIDDKEKYNHEKKKKLTFTINLDDAAVSFQEYCNYYNIFYKTDFKQITNDRYECILTVNNKSFSGVGLGKKDAKWIACRNFLKNKIEEDT